LGQQTVPNAAEDSQTQEHLTNGREASRYKMQTWIVNARKREKRRETWAGALAYLHTWRRESEEEARREIVQTWKDKAREIDMRRERWARETLEKREREREAAMERGGGGR
jgi:hypothetical protein